MLRKQLRRTHFQMSGAKGLLGQFSLLRQCEPLLETLNSVLGGQLFHLGKRVRVNEGFNIGEPACALI